MFKFNHTLSLLNRYDGRNTYVCFCELWIDIQNRVNTVILLNQRMNPPYFACFVFFFADIFFYIPFFFSYVLLYIFMVNLFSFLLWIVVYMSLWLCFCCRCEYLVYVWRIYWVLIRGTLMREKFFSFQFEIAYFYLNMYKSSKGTTTTAAAACKLLVVEFLVCCCYHYWKFIEEFLNRNSDPPTITYTSI